MIKYWQSMHDHLHFFHESKVHFDSSERTRLHTEFWKPWQKLRRFDTDRAMGGLLPFYSTTGRVIKTRPEWDIRLYTDVSRRTETYKRIYNQRTATERINNRILNNHGLHRMMIHTKKHYSFMTTIISICINLDARYKQAQAEASLLSALHANAFKLPLSESLKTMPFFIQRFIPLYITSNTSAFLLRPYFSQKLIEFLRPLIRCPTPVASTIAIFTFTSPFQIPQSLIYDSSAKYHQSKIVQHFALQS